MSLFILYNVAHNEEDDS